MVVFPVVWGSCGELDYRTVIYIRNQVLMADCHAPAVSYYGAVYAVLAERREWRSMGCWSVIFAEVEHE